MASAYQQSFEGMGEVRVRFAPSPTGFLHIGSARTALFNWLFARKYQGAFILRIEDTDLQRSQKIYEKDILDGLRLLGLDWDEGPDIGGEYGPYRQSERKEIYLKYTEQLINEGKAYRCFCSKDELLAEQQDMIARGEVPHYSGRCRVLTEQQIKENLRQGLPFIVRLRMPSQKVGFEDLIRGKIEFSTELLGDIAITRGLDDPLYNYAVVIDDNLMEISHVIRGEDHISNTPKQIMIQKALGWETPYYAHLPLILGSDRTKLSKRHGATSLKDYILDGYLPEAVINFLVLLGWHSALDREVFALDELISEFDLNRVQKGGAIFNLNRLNWFNGFYLKKKSPDELLQLAQEVYLREEMLTAGKKKGFFKQPLTREEFSEEYLLKVVSLALDRLQKLSQLPEMTDYFFKEPEYETTMLFWKQMTKDELIISLQASQAALAELENADFTKEKINEALIPLYATDKGRVLWPLRVCLSGREASPPPFEIAEILGKTKVLQRIETALNKLANGS